MVNMPKYKSVPGCECDLCMPVRELTIAERAARYLAPGRMIECTIETVGNMGRLLSEAVIEIARQADIITSWKKAAGDRLNMLLDERQTATALRAEIARLRPQGANRYWEGRWRDNERELEAVREHNAELLAERDEAIAKTERLRLHSLEIDAGLRLEITKWQNAAKHHQDNANTLSREVDALKERIVAKISGRPPNVTPYEGGKPIRRLTPLEVDVIEAACAYIDTDNEPLSKRLPVLKQLQDAVDAYQAS